MTITAKWSDFSNLDRDQLVTLATERLPRWVTVILVAAFAWQLSSMLWMLLPGSTAGEPIAIPSSQATTGPDASAPGQPNVRLIAATHLFGKAAIDEDPVPVRGPDIGALPSARVNLSLKGTVTASVADESIAIIADSSKEENVYKIGDPVQVGTTLHAIHRDLVVLNQNGSLSKLELPKDFPQSAPTVRRTSARASRATSSNRSIQNVVAQNVSKLADVIRPTPYFVGGQQQGYRVYPGRNRKQFAALGLRPGDLIKDIDGASLTDPKQAMTIFQNLGNAEQVSVTVERNGQPQTLILKTSQLQLDKNK